MLYFIVALGLTLALLRLTVIDLKTQRLPDHYTLPLIVVGLGLSLCDGGIGLRPSVIGGGVGFALFWAIGAFYFRRRGTEGLGLGDAKLFAASGTWLGYLWLPYVLLIAAFGGLAFAILRRSETGRALAFGPWLALGFWGIWMVTSFW
ncbi:MAG: leader peptidase (prepilin peptidase)/N-methyltransferase [Sulfitobacter sp.]